MISLLFLWFLIPQISCQITLFTFKDQRSIDGTASASLSQGTITCTVSTTNGVLRSNGVGAGVAAVSESSGPDVFINATVQESIRITFSPAVKLQSIALASFDSNGDAAFLSLSAPAGVTPPSPATLVMSAATQSFAATPAIDTIVVQATAGAFQLDSVSVFQDDTIGATSSPSATVGPDTTSGDKAADGGMGIGAIIGIVVVVVILVGTLIGTLLFKQRNGRYPTGSDAVGFWKYTVLNEPRPAGADGRKSRRSSTRDPAGTNGGPPPKPAAAGPAGPGGYPNQQFGQQQQHGGWGGQQQQQGYGQQAQWGGGSPYPANGGSFAGGQYPQQGQQQSQFSAGNAFAPPGGQAGPGSYQGVFSNASAPGAPAGTPGIACGYPGCSNTYLTQQDLQIHKQKRGHFT
mmetsp:Transcript_14810/g.46432  ORF Transcript_14810/g.46432 Transcript_14810/m.46432 type:complete len:404 (-) Transcript_14810:578-1789(-)